jgi:hypothetical protein
LLGGKVCQESFLRRSLQEYGKELSPWSQGDICYASMDDNSYFLFGVDHIVRTLFLGTMYEEAEDKKKTNFCCKSVLEQSEKRERLEEVR